MTTRRREPLPHNWNALKRAHFEKAENQYCSWITNGMMCGNAYELEVDHYGEPWEHDKLRTLCRWHHSQRTKAQATAARWKHTNQRKPERHPGFS